MKKIVLQYASLAMALILLLSLAACVRAGGRTGAPTEAETVSPGVDPAGEGSSPNDTPTEPSGNEATVSAGKQTLVVYFSATGTTKAVAQTIAAISDADLYEIKAAQAYSADDLDWRDDSSRATREQNDKNARPELGGQALSLSGYTRAFIGYPIWFGEEPRIMDTFVESYDFSGVTLIPFCTSSSSGIGRSSENLAENAGGGTWLEGCRFGAGVSESELRAWIDSLG